MAYIGNIPAESYASFETETFSVSATANYTLSHAVTNENEIRLVINGVVQQPGSGKAYTASGTTLTLTSATVSGDVMYAVYLGRALQTVNPPNASVGSAQIADSLISGKTALGATPADTDELLISDAGTLKRVDFSHLKQANTPAFFAYSGATQNPADTTNTTVAFGTELFDTDSCYNTSTYTFTPNVAGKYYLFCNIRVDTDSGTHSLIEAQARIRKNGGDCANYLWSSYNSSNLTGINMTMSTIVDANGSSDAFLCDVYLDKDAGTNRLYSAQNQTYFGGYKLIGV